LKIKERRGKKSAKRGTRGGKPMKTQGLTIGSVPGRSPKYKLLSRLLGAPETTSQKLDSNGSAQKRVNTADVEHREHGENECQRNFLAPNLRILVKSA
jgi:hypothetical protein